MADPRPDHRGPAVVPVRQPARPGNRAAAVHPDRGRADRRGRPKGVIAPGYLADLAILSGDYFTVPAEDISRIESVLTIVGGKIVYSAAEYEGLAAAPPPITLQWSPVEHYGGYHQPAEPTTQPGARQATTLAEAAIDSEEQRQWRTACDGAPKFR